MGNAQAHQRIVIKVGTSTLTAGTGRLDPPRMVDLVRQIAALRQAGHSVLLVTSGAQQAGRERLAQSQAQRTQASKTQELRTIPFKQMLAAVGQGRLMHLWEQYFDIFGIVVAQVLLTRQDIEDRRRYLSIRDTLDSLIEQGIVPIINENDAVATDEIKVGENDSLSAMVSNVVDANLLVLLTDLDGLYTADPSTDPSAKLIARVDTIDATIHERATGSRSGLGTGGMQTKIVAAEIATRGGTSVVIANGERDDVLLDVLAERGPATWFPASITPHEGRKHWLLAQSMTPHSVTVDDGAARAVTQSGRSLLPVGIVRCACEFERGAIVKVLNRKGQEIARGLANYSSADLTRILGQQSEDIGDLLGYDYGPAFIHRDKMTVFEG